MSAYALVIVASTLIILSYLFTLISKRTNIPSVLMLLVTGVVAKRAMDYLNIGRIDWFPYLEVLGIVGLIMIVLEAALDLKLERNKMALISKSLVLALIGTLGSAGIAAVLFHTFISGFSWLSAFLYATPLSILSSAIIIPSVTELPALKKELCIYESTFSDIIGIMMFYFLISMSDPNIAGDDAVISFIWSIVVTVAISALASFVLIYMFQNIRTQVKTFLLLAILILLYGVGKMFHLSSLILILVFGLAISNANIFFPGFLKKHLKAESVKSLFHELHIVTAETAFVVRTFFFIIFGITIALSSLFHFQVLLVSALLLATIYGLRFILFKVMLGADIYPEVYIAPRGLVTVLLFFAIPKELQVAEFENGILLFVIIASSIVMTWGMIRAQRKDVASEVMAMLNKDLEPSASPDVKSMEEGT